MEILGRVKSAAMLDRPAQNAKETFREFCRNGPVEAARTGIKLVWNTNAQRVDNVVGTKLAQGGPV